VTRLPALAVWVLALLLVTLAVAAQEKAPSADSSITQRVESALAQDSALARMDIKVETRDGVVSLTGFVRSIEDAARAGGLAQEVPGVSAVRNDLRVANRPSRASAPAAAARIQS
jgi:hypothetical protein